MTSKLRLSHGKAAVSLHKAKRHRRLSNLYLKTGSRLWPKLRLPLPLVHSPIIPRLPPSLVASQQGTGDREKNRSQFICVGHLNALSNIVHRTNVCCSSSFVVQVGMKLGRNELTEWQLLRRCNAYTQATLRDARSKT